MVDQPFVSFAFPALNAPTSRTMPVRLSEVMNVRDWGAKGNNVDNDGAAINQCIQACIANGGGQIYFPTGAYACTGVPIVVGHPTSNVSVQLLGSGQAACQLINASISGGAGNIDCLDRMEHMKFSGSLTPTRTGFQAVMLNGGPFDLRNCVGGLLLHCMNGSAGSHGGANAPTNCQGTYCVALGKNCIAVGCRFMGVVEATYCLCGDGAAMFACSGESTWVNIRVGWTPGVGETLVHGCVVDTYQSEQTQVCVELYYADSCYVANLYQGGAVGIPDPQTITSGSWSGGVATLSTAPTPHGIPTSQRIQMHPAPSNGAWLPNGKNIFDVTVSDTTHFQYPLATNPGAWGTGGWSWPQESMIKVRKASNCIIASMASAIHAFGDVDLSFRDARRPWGMETESGNATHLNNVILATTAPMGWLLPAAANRASWRFIKCSGAASPYGDTTIVADPYGNIRFANLPGQSGVNQTLVEAAEYDIIDASTVSLGAAVTAGGGSGHYKVRWNGTSWIRVG